MKKPSLTLFLSLLVVLGCADENGILGIPQKITLNITLNENSTPTSSLNDHITYRASANLDLSQGQRIENIVLHGISVKVISYDCSLVQLHSMLLSEHYTDDGLALDAFPFIAQENFSGKVSDKVFLKGMEQELKTVQFTGIDFQTTLPPSITDFEIRLTIDLDLTIQYEL